MAGKRSTSALRKASPADAVVVAFPARGHAGVLSPVTGERPAAPAIERSPFWLALVLSLALHAAALAVLQPWTENDLERALGNAAMPSAEGTVVVIPVEVVADSALPSAAAPTNATSPEAQTPNTAEATEQEKPKPEPEAPAESAPTPPPLAVEIPAPESAVPPPDPLKLVEPKPEPQPNEVRRTETRLAAPSAAAAPARSAASATPGRAGNRGNIETGGAALVSSYQAQVQAHLQRFRTYPEAARSRGITGVATVRFALGRDGQVLSASLVRGSGASVLDEAALAVVRRASPFPPFPVGLGRARMDFAAPMRFDLR